MEHKTINIAYQSSNEYAQICLVSLYSFLENNQYLNDVRLYILSSNFTHESLILFQKALKQYGYDEHNVFIINISNIKSDYELLFDDYNGKWGIDSFSRLLLGSLLPIDVEKILYLDSDTIICKSLWDIYEQDMGDYYAFATRDLLSKKYLSFLNISANFYCNSGVILFNLKKWRDDKVENKVQQYLKEKHGFVFFSEQSVFNYVCQNRIKLLPLGFNLYSLVTLCSYKNINALRKPSYPYSKEELVVALNNPTIIHYTSFFLINNRVWYKNSNHPMKNHFDKYAKFNPNFAYYSDNRSNFKKILAFLL